jgi:hypothetical protein
MNEIMREMVRKICRTEKENTEAIGGKHFEKYMHKNL